MGLKSSWHHYGTIQSLTLDVPGYDSWVLHQRNRPIVFDGFNPITFDAKSSYTIWFFNIAMVYLGLPIKTGDFPWRTVSHNQMVYQSCSVQNGWNHQQCEIFSQHPPANKTIPSCQREWLNGWDTKDGKWWLMMVNNGFWATPLRGRCWCFRWWVWSSVQIVMAHAGKCEKKCAWSSNDGGGFKGTAAANIS